MPEDKEIDAYLSKGQFNNLNKGKPFQMKHHQFLEPTEKTDHHVKLQVGHGHFKKITKHIATGKGIRMTHEMVKGGAFLGKIGSMLSSVANNDAVKKFAINGAKTVAKKVAKKLNVDPSIVDSVSNAIQGEGFAKGSPEAHSHAQKMRSAKTPKASHSGKSHFVKGSPEAKAHMAKLRALKGKGIFGDVLNGAKKLAGNKAVQKIASTALKKGLSMTPVGKLVPSSVTDNLINSGVSMAGNQVAGSGLFGDVLKGAKKLAANKAVQGIAAKALKTGLSMTPIGNLVPASVTNNLIDSGVSAGGNAIAGSGVYTRTKNSYHPIKGGFVSNVYTNPRRVKALTGGSFREL
jgi:hypothetical protein